MSKRDQCEDEIIVREINRYENETLQNKFLFLNHTNDYSGCLINVSAHEMPPFLSFNGDVNNETHLIELERLGGIEGEIFKIVADALNVEIRLNFPKEISAIRRIHYSLGCFGDLDKKRSQIAIGGFNSTLWNSEKYSTSSVYYTSSYVFVVRSGLCFGTIKQLLNILCLYAWIFMLIFISISIILTKIVQTKPKVRDFVFGPENKMHSMFATFFGNFRPIQIIPKRNFVRFLLASWLLISFQVRNGYQGIMFDSLRFLKCIPVPQTISHLIEQDYILLASSYNEFYPINKTQITPNTTNCLDIVQKSTSPVTAVALLDSLAYDNYMNSNTSTLTYVKEIVSCYVFSKTFAVA
ncbi:uncharacterized protein LOC119602026 [Lucilia sericata]|uniref:uncharacterized protein LOC119602026 n=1 Tax=Lucilia sericata TaxID=13632 RepID=UPI0018A84507|nr:uncharacterized protein LOC119602026 [Lucilia sericata]